MDDFQTAEEIALNVDEASNVVKECIENIVGGVDYNHSKINQWTAAIVEQSLMHLVKMGKPFKYIVTCAVMQKSGAGLHTASSCYWDNSTDGNFIEEFCKAGNRKIISDERSTKKANFLSPRRCLTG